MESTVNKDNAVSRLQRLLCSRCDDIPKRGRNPSKSIEICSSLTIDILSGLSYMVGLCDSGDSELGGELEKANWLRRSVARRDDWGLARALRLAVDAVNDGSVALDRSSLGLRPPPFDLDESLLCMPARRVSGVDEPIVSSSESDV